MAVSDGSRTIAPSAIVGDATLYHADCRDVLRGLPDNSIDSVVTDPPYALVSIQKRFGKPGSSPVKVADVNASNDLKAAYARASAGFMGKTWDTGEVAFSEEFWAEVLRVLKPGGHVVAFSGTRTYHRMAVAIEDAGFEIRDQLGWLYGSGFPKSHDVSKGIDRAGGTPWAGFAGLLDDLIKSSGHTYASLDRALGIKSSSCYWVRTDSRGGLPPRHHYERIKSLINPPKEFTDLYDKAEREVIAIDRRKNSPSGIVSAGRESVDVERKITAPATDAAREWQGWGTALKPAWEPICLARKPLDGTVAENVLEHGTGALNIDGCRVVTDENLNGGAYAKTSVKGSGSSYTLGVTDRVYSQPPGRWPANIVHDGSDEVLAAFPDGGAHGGKGKFVQHAWAGREATEQDIKRSTGSAARFFYCAKASRKDRDEGLEQAEGRADAAHRRTNVEETADNPYLRGVTVRKNTHPTVKPTALMQWLCRLVTPPGGVILDPFMGSGSTGKAALLEGFKFIGCEREDEYMPIAQARIAAALRRETQQATNDNQASLFDEVA